MPSVEEIYANAQTFAYDIQAAARFAVSDTLAAVANVKGADAPALDGSYRGVNFKWPEDLDKSTQLVNGSFSMPVEPSVDVTVPTAMEIDASGAPVLTATAPSVTLPNRPSGVADWVGAAPAVTTDFVFPDAPAEISKPLPEAPELGTYAVPIKGGIARGSLDDNSIVAPTFTGREGTIATARAEYSATLVAAAEGYVDRMLATYNPEYHTAMSRIEAQLQKYLDGGTGLKAEVEDAIYSRARAKNDVEARRVIDSAAADAAARGFSMPSGALMSAMARARQEAANNNAKTATEIAIAQAEMEQKNLQFAVTTSAGLRTTMVNAAMTYMRTMVDVNAQALDCAKTVLSEAIEMYNARARQVGIQLDVYKTDIMAYEARMKDAQLTADLYKTEIAAMESLVNVDRAKVEIYKSRLDALTAATGVYKSQIEAVQSRAALERLKIDVFQAQVQAYATQVQAKNAEWQGYTAAISGEETKARLFAAQVEGYRAQVEGYKTKIEAQSAASAAKNAQTQMLLEHAKTKAGLFSTVVQARATEAGVTQENTKLNIAYYSAINQFAASYNDSAVRYVSAMNSNTAAMNQAKIQAAAEEYRSATARLQTIAGVSSITANTLSGMAQAAMSGMNVLAAQTETI